MLLSLYIHGGTHTHTVLKGQNCPFGKKIKRQNLALNHTFSTVHIRVIVSKCSEDDFAQFSTNSPLRRKSNPSRPNKGFAFHNRTHMFLFATFPLCCYANKWHAWGGLMAVARQLTSASAPVHILISRRRHGVRCVAGAMRCLLVPSFCLSP